MTTENLEEVLIQMRQGYYTAMNAATDTLQHLNKLRTIIALPFDAVIAHSTTLYEDCAARYAITCEALNLLYESAPEDELRPLLSVLNSSTKLELKAGEGIKVH